MNRIGIGFLLGLLVGATTVFADDLAFYGFGTTSNDWSSSDTDELSTAADMVKGPGISESWSGFHSSIGLPPRSFGFGLNDLPGTIDDAIDLGDYLSFTIDVLTNNIMMFTNISVDVRYKYAEGNGSVAVFSSVDGWASESDALGSITLTTSDGWKKLSIPLGTNYVKFLGPVEFRFYTRDSKGRADTGVHVDNVRLQGRAYPYPGLVITIF